MSWLVLALVACSTSGADPAATFEAAASGLEATWQDHMAEVFGQMDPLDPSWSDGCGGW